MSLETPPPPPVSLESEHSADDRPFTEKSDAKEQTPPKEGEHFARSVDDSVEKRSDDSELSGDGDASRDAANFGERGDGVEPESTPDSSAASEAEAPRLVVPAATSGVTGAEAVSGAQGKPLEISLLGGNTSRTGMVSPFAGASDEEIVAAAAAAARAEAEARAENTARADFDDFDDDEFGWAMGSELEFLEDEPAGDWDGPVGDGLEEELGVNRHNREKSPSEGETSSDA